MVDYSKWDALELSDDSDIEVHPNVDKRSFIRAKQNQIHEQRIQRKLQIKALTYECTVNNTLFLRLSYVLQELKSTAHEAPVGNPGDIAFQAIMASKTNQEDDNPPPKPEGVFDSEQKLPPYSKMMANLLDEVNQTLNEKVVDQNDRFEAFIKELDGHMRRIQNLQRKQTQKLNDLKKLDEIKITSDSFHVGFDSSHVSKSTPGESSNNTQTELLNLNYTKSADTANAGIDARITPSSQANEFAHIQAENYPSSLAFISSHPRILQESQTDALLTMAINIALQDHDDPQVYQYVHQALLLQWCRVLGRDGVTMFFKVMSSPGHRAREAFEKEVTEKVSRIKQMARGNLEKNGENGENLEQIQIHPIDRNTTINIRIPQIDSHDTEERKAREIFDSFSPEMKVALQTGSLDNLNRVLGNMNVQEAEETVALLSNAGCLRIEDGVIDTTTEKGKKQLQDLEMTRV